ncbi:hypothetical protein EON66_07800 [archaeon]|nr:MAG: hypothetical protein EON66_07800 [archaeon]
MQEPYMRLHTFGGLGSCTVDVAKSSDAFLTFEADAAHAYALHLDRHDSSQSLCMHSAAGCAARTQPAASCSRSPCVWVHTLCRFTYNLRLIESGLRAVAAAKQTFLRLNAAGMLSFAHKLETEDGACGCAGVRTCTSTCTLWLVHLHVLRSLARLARCRLKHNHQLYHHA